MKAKQFESISLRHLDALYGYAMRLARNYENAEDLVQETYARAFAHCDRVPDAGAVRPTLFRILHNLFVDQWRASRRGPVMVSTDSMQDASGQDSLPFLRDPDNPRDLLMRDALSDEVESALSQLDEAWRETLWLREIEDFSYEEISRVTEVPIGTVRSRLARARRALAASLAEYARSRGVIPRNAGRKEDRSS